MLFKNALKCSRGRNEIKLLLISNVWLINTGKEGGRESE